MKIVAIYDNGGETLDRYTVVTDEAVAYGSHSMLGLSEGGVGFSQWSDGQFHYDEDNEHLGKRIPFESLTAATQAHIASRVLT
jgi:hypothetical protein